MKQQGQLLAQPTPEPARRRVTRDTRGAVLVEYIILVTCVGLLVALALTEMTPRLVQSYSRQRASMYQPYP